MNTAFFPAILTMPCCIAVRSSSHPSSSSLSTIFFFSPWEVHAPSKNKQPVSRRTQIHLSLGQWILSLSLYLPLTFCFQLCLSFLVLQMFNKWLESLWWKWRRSDPFPFLYCRCFRLHHARDVWDCKLLSLICFTSCNGDVSDCRCKRRQMFAKCTCLTMPAVTVDSDWRSDPSPPCFLSHIGRCFRLHFFLENGGSHCGLKVKKVMKFLIP